MNLQNERAIVTLTWQQKVKSAFSSLLPAKDMKVGIDVSRYTPILKIEELRGNIDFMFAKAVEVGDAALSWNANMSVDQFCTAPAILNHHAQVAYDLNIPFGVYLFDNPAYKAEWGGRVPGYTTWPSTDNMAEIKALRQACGTGMVYHNITIDVERWWQLYSEWYNDRPNARKVSPAWILDSVAFLEYQVLKDMQAGNLRTVPLLYYTGKWFVDSYCPQLDTFLASRKQWLAAYPQPFYSNVSSYTTWTQLHAAIDLLTYNPAWVGNKDCEMHQLGDNFKYGGTYNPDGITRTGVDYNRCRVPLSDVFAPGRWSGVVTPPPPPPPVDPIGKTNDEIYAQILTLADDIRGLKDDVTSIRGHFK